MTRVCNISIFLRNGNTKLDLATSGRSLALVATIDGNVFLLLDGRRVPTGLLSVPFHLCSTFQSSVEEASDHQGACICVMELQRYPNLCLHKNIAMICFPD